MSDAMMQVLLQRDDVLRYRKRVEEALGYFERRAEEADDLRLSNHMRAMANSYASLLSRYEELLTILEDRIAAIDRLTRDRKSH